MIRLTLREMVVLSSVVFLLAGCAGNRSFKGGADEGRKRSGSGATPTLPAAGSGRGGYYQDDGPGDSPPYDLQSIPDAEPKIEPYSKFANRPYVVFGKTYTPLTDGRPLKQRGIGSWYGKKFHGQKTSSSEIYDMYKMTAAHPTLPLPSYARVTNTTNGAQVIVRVNDRGPFHSGRIIDLSYVAAFKLGYLKNGSSELEVERLLPEDIARINSGQFAVPQTAFSTSTSTSTSTAASLPAPTLSNPAFGSPPYSSSPVDAGLPLLSLDDFLESQQVPQVKETPTIQTGMAAGTSTGPSEAIAPAASGGYYLQFGAFSQSANADAMREQLLQAWPSSLPRPTTQQRGAVFRLYSGPFQTRTEAVRAATLLTDNPLAQPLVVQP